jgi:hypothetical protein
MEGENGRSESDEDKSNDEGYKTDESAENEIAAQSSFLPDASIFLLHSSLFHTNLSHLSAQLLIYS